MDVTDAHLVGDDPGRFLLVAGHHGEALYTQGTKVGNGLRGIIPGYILHDNPRRHIPVNGDVSSHLVGGERCKGTL